MVAPVDVADVVALAVFAVADELEAFAEVAGQGHAARLIAPAGGEDQSAQAAELGIDQQSVLLGEGVLGAEDAEGKAGLDAETSRSGISHAGCNADPAER